MNPKTSRQPVLPILLFITFASASVIPSFPSASAEEQPQAPAPQEPTWYFEKGEEHEAQGEYQQAAEAYRRAIERSLATEPDGKNPEELAKWHAEQSRLLMKRGEASQAVSHAERAIELQPGRKEYEALLSKARDAQKEELARSEELAELKREAAAAQQEGNGKKALRALRKAQKLAPKDQEVAAEIEAIEASGDRNKARRQTAEELEINAPNAKLAEYRVSPGDVLEIFVWQQDDLTRDLIVRPDGRLAFPLIGDVAVAGLTLVELDQLLTQRLKAYLRYPDVSLAIKRFGGTKIIVMGEVSTPGIYVPPGQGHVLDVIAMAGGFTRDARQDSIILIRGGLATPELAKLNMEKVLERGAMQDNVTLQADDIIFVPRTWIASTNHFLGQMGPVIGNFLVAQSIATNFGAREASGGITR